MSAVRFWLCKVQHLSFLGHCYSTHPSFLPPSSLQPSWQTWEHMVLGTRTKMSHLMILWMIMMMKMRPLKLWVKTLVNKLLQEEIESHCMKHNSLPVFWDQKKPVGWSALLLVQSTTVIVTSSTSSCGGGLATRLWANAGLVSNSVGKPLLLLLNDYILLPFLPYRYED